MHGVEWLVDGWGGRLGSLSPLSLSRASSLLNCHNAHAHMP